MNVVCGWPVPKELLQKVEAVSPEVKLNDGWGLMQSEFRLLRDGGDPQGLERASQQLNEMLDEAEVLFTRHLPGNLIKRAPKLRWIQLAGAGIDFFLGTETMESDVVLTNASGASAIPIAEFVIGYMIMFVKQCPDLFAHKRERLWQRRTYNVSELFGKTIGIVGLGSIGKEVARLANAFGMRVIATRRSAVAESDRIANVDTLLPRNALLNLLAKSDFVVLCVPLTTETSKMIGERDLKAMKRTAYLINIARGSVVDEQALIRALKEGWIAGAALDVFEVEPLPKESPLWDLPNVILSPHISGTSDRFEERVTDIFCENLKRYLAGKELTNVVDKARGY
ncbi:MAG: D-2-hydroxyacid dehydrogenase [Chloroflexi bacterium]|nr:D-2-hydroxyacid dehydrogenase [Chloroflexota bacterium]